MTNGKSPLLRPWATYVQLQKMHGALLESARQAVQRLGIVFPGPREPKEKP